MAFLFYPIITSLATEVLDENNSAFSFLKVCLPVSVLLSQVLAFTASIAHGSPDSLSSLQGNVGPESLSH